MNKGKRQATQIEKTGLTYEKSQLPPLAARTKALLLVAEPPYCLFEEIKENLQAGKSSMSLSLTLFLKEGIVD